MKVLYVTTFNKRLFDMTGKRLVESYLKNTKDSDLLICYEDMDKSLIPESDRIILYDVAQSEYFNKWINDNLDNIPEFYGGNAKDDDPRFILDREKGQYWARFRASRYFRKIVALNTALQNELTKDKYDLIFLIDSDCIIKKNIDGAKIEELFKNDITMFYYWGKYRKKINRGPESGFTGYMKKNKGFEFAKVICDCFSSGKFLDYEYWDDGFVIGKLIEENINNYKFKDLVEGTNKRTTRVMDIYYNTLFEYIHHYKNTH